MPSRIAPDCLYAKSHEWIRVENDHATVGISDYAQHELTDIVYVELPKIGQTFGQNEPFAVVESVKAASDVFMPVAGEIIEVNKTLEEAPEFLNEDPYGDGWLVRIRILRPEQLSSLMDAQAYRAFLETQEGEG